MPGAEPTVVAHGGGPRSWARMPRLDGGRETERLALEALDEARRSGRPVGRVVGVQERQRRRVSATPVVGPSGAVHAVELWVGDPGLEPPRPSAAVAFEWSSASRLVELNADSGAELVGMAGRHSWTAPEVFSRIVRFDAAMSLISKAIAPVPEDRWEGTVTVNAPGGVRTAHLAMRSMPAPQEHAWRGVLHDVTDAVPPSPPTLESVAVTGLTAGRGSTAVALMDVERARLITWFTDPVPGIQWKGMVDDRDTPHPDDVVRIFAAMQQLGAGTTTEAAVPGVRLRRRGGGWTVIDARLTVVPVSGPTLVLAELMPVDDGA